jgi:hypothetical protein
MRAGGEMAGNTLRVRIRSRSEKIAVPTSITRKTRIALAALANPPS